MNTPYDFKESAELITKLVDLTRRGKVEWRERRSFVRTIGPAVTEYSSALEGDSEALVWSSDNSSGFRVVERTEQKGVALMSIATRDLISISIDHENGPSEGELYVNLMALLELARRSADKIEPKIDRVKQFLDELAS